MEGTADVSNVRKYRERIKLADGNSPRFSQGRDVRTVASAEGPAQAARSHSGAPSPEGQWWGLGAEWTWGRTRGGAEDDRRIRCGAQRGLQSQSAQCGSDVTLHVGCSACQRASRLMRPPGGWRAGPVRHSGGTSSSTWRRSRAAEAAS